MYDVIIIGAGPAGISAAIYAKRAGMNALVFHYGISEVEKASKIDNYYGFQDGILGDELFKTGIKQAKNIGVEVVEKEVIDIEIENDSVFKVILTNEFYEAKAVILATGNKRIKPNIKGIDEFEGKGISYCAICDGFFYRNKNVVVIGNGDFAINEANSLANVTENVRILTNGMPKPVTEKFEVDTRAIKEVNGEEKIEYIEFQNGEKMNVDGIFIAEGTAGGMNFARKLGIATKDNNIVVNENMETNIKGIFACGNLTGGLLQISKAVYEGAKAGLQAVEHVKNM